MSNKVKKLLSLFIALAMIIGISSYYPKDVQASGEEAYNLAGITVNLNWIQPGNTEASLYDSSGNIVKVLDPISSEWKDSFKCDDPISYNAQRLIISRTDFEKIKNSGVKLKFAGNVDGDDYIYLGNEGLNVSGLNKELYEKSGKADFDYGKYIFGNNPVDETELEQYYISDDAFMGDYFGSYSKKVFNFGSIDTLYASYIKAKVKWIGEPAESAELKVSYQLKDRIVINSPVEPFEDRVIREFNKSVKAEDDWEWIFLYNEDENLAETNINAIPEKYWRLDELMKSSNKYTFRPTTVDGTAYDLAYHYMQGLPLEGYEMTGPENRGYKMGEYTDPLDNVYEITYSKIEDPETDLELDKENHIKYMNGYPDGTFGPTKNITREETAQMFFNLLTATSKQKYKGSAMHFPDVNENGWSGEAIAVLSKGKVINGYPDGTFRPENYITRAEAVKLANGVLERAVKPENIPAEAKQWPDVPKEAWYYPEIIEATNSHDYERLQDGTEDWTLVK